MEEKLSNVLLESFEPFDDEDDRIDERFYEFVDEEILKDFLRIL